jgi:hypothetical protein
VRSHGAVAELHGGFPCYRRRVVTAAFNDDPEVRVLLANDAAGALYCFVQMAGGIALLAGVIGLAVHLTS